MTEFLDQLEFRSAWLLWTGLLAPALYLVARAGGGRMRFSALSLLPTARASWRLRLAWVPSLLTMLAWLSLSVALAGPRLGKDSGRKKREGIAIMMAIDVSGSMRALDLSLPQRERTRLDAVKDVFADFVGGGGGLPGRPDDAIGLVSFAGFADTRCPLTLDHGALSAIAKDLEIVTERQEDGTALGDALGLAVARLRAHPAKSKIVILLTDGVQTAGESTPQEAAELAQALGIKIYTVGAGTNGVAPVRAPDPFTGEMTLQPQPVRIDEETLRAAADVSGGKYFRAEDAEGLRRVYREIDTLERTEIVEQRFREYRELYPYAGAGAFALLVLASLLSATWLRRLP